MNIYSGKSLEEALDRAADEENVDVEYLQYRILKNDDSICEIEAYFVADVIDFGHWYFGHFHAHRYNMDVEKSHPGQGRVSMLYDQVEQLTDGEGKLAWLVNINNEPMPKED